MTQRERLRDHLESVGEITSLEAMQRYGIMQTPRCVHELRVAGLPVQTRFKIVKNRYGEKARIAVYSLTKGADR